MIVARIDARKGKTTPKYVSAIVTALIVLVMFIAIPTGSSGKTPEHLDRQSETVDTTDPTETDPTETEDILALQPSETASDATEPSTEAVASSAALSEATEPMEETQPEQKQQTPTQLETAPETQPATEKTPEPEPVIEPAVEPATTPPTEPPATAANSSGTMVWITTGGGKYHSDPNCSNMKNPYQITLEEAIAMGREPCKNCYH